MLTKTSKYPLVAAFLLSVFISATSQAQTSIFPTDDAYTSESSPNENFGGEAELRINKSFNGNEENAFLSFDLNGASEDFEQVLLKITSPDSTHISTQLRLLPNDISETSITWNNQPTNAEFVFHGGLSEGKAIYFDVTDIASERIDQNGTLNFLLYSNLIGNTSQVFADVIGTSIEQGNEGEFASIIMETRNNFEETLDQYGGLVLPGVSYEATGYFRTENIDGVWNYIDPLGNIFYSVGLNSVDQTSELDLPQDFVDLGINTMGSWSEEIGDIAYTPMLNVLRKFQNDVDGDAELTWDAFVLPVFEQDFESYVNEMMPGWLEPYKDDPYLLGYFLDNELKFSDTQLEKSLNFAPTNDQFIKADEYMTTTYGPNYSPNQVTDEDELIYVGMVADTYFSIVTEAVRNVDLLTTTVNGRF